MASCLNKYHKEYSCIQQIVEDEKESVKKRFNRNRKLWTVYMGLLLISFFLLPIWMTFLICLGGFILFPATTHEKKLLTDTPFLVIDYKYVQSKGKIISWNRIVKISITHEIVNKKKNHYNYTISFKHQSGKEEIVNTCYFCNQEDIVNSIVLLATAKNIPIEKNGSLELFEQDALLV